jgi:hypothetical protein
VTEERDQREEPDPSRASPSPGADSEGPILDALWSRALEAWDDDKPHHALLEYALRAQKLPELAGRYRAIKEKDPQKADRAQKKLDGIVIAATQMMMAMKSPPDRFKVPPAMTATFFALSLLLLSWLAYAVFRRR